MAFLVRRGGGRFDIRESVSTARGPRARTLASFRGALTPEVLERAEARASRPFDGAEVAARAEALGVPVTARREDREARALLGALRTGRPVDPSLVTLLREELREQPAEPVPEELAEVAEWVGVDERERGRALRDLLRVSDRIFRSRRPVRERRRVPFPRFSSRRRRSG